MFLGERKSLQRGWSFSLEVWKNSYQRRREDIRKGITVKRKRG